ncbi:aromatic ring-hydroxylating dioxygenase subunit alpha [uncultured Azohydromonas sp.]|jgi:Phenylpropionate dioxygenase and related ring-hydroxylating dioxygenases, large terminal subunit|uniref:aromatic ring-hydroxylating oxygenase subunit alpha n=1 Tax=uncultured Azohydromonas sp. TaxID=487342 RepID=UPI0026232900|nr:aromatic ring-hydroxylating dioxygenase subunit alpha [uncultured Azohydromonas sp.]
MFLKNTWYVAARPEEIDGKPLGRKVCNEAIVFYRQADGSPAAVEDFCPHRGAPLSLGYVSDGKLVCGYHGLEMGCEGKAIAMPGQRVRGFPCIKSYAVVERHGFIWVWPGEKDKADPALIPELHWANNPEWAYGGGLYHVKADYRLMIDNLMDLTHETYVHSTSIGQKEIDETPCTTKVEGDHVTTSRFMDNVPEAPPFWKLALRGHGLPDNQPVDRWQICHFTPPTHVMIEVGVALQGHGGYDAPADKKVYAIVVDFITPETETSHHYFWGMARNFKAQDPALTVAIREGQGKVFAEDMEMLERQQLNLSAWPDRKLLMLNIDAGGVQSRRVIDRLLAAEKAPQAQPAPPAQAAVAEAAQ